MGVKGASAAPKSQPKPAQKAPQKSAQSSGGKQAATKPQGNTDTKDVKQTQNSEKSGNIKNASQDMKNPQLSDREKEIQKDLDKGEVNIKSGDKLGNYSRAMADGSVDGKKDGQLSKEELDKLPGITKALMDKNPELAKLAKDQGIDPADPNNSDKLMQMDLTDKDGKPLASDKVKIPNQEELQKAEKEAQQSDEIPNEDPVKADHIGGNCNKNHDKDIISQMSQKLEEGDKLASEGKASEAAQAYNEVLSMGSQALQSGGAADGGKGAKGPMDYANKDDLNKPSKLKEGNPQAYNQSVQNLSASKPEVKDAVNKLQTNPDQRIQKIVDLMASAEAKLSKQKQDGQKDVKRQTNGDPNAQQGQLTAQNYKAPKVSPPPNTKAA